MQILMFNFSGSVSTPLAKGNQNFGRKMEHPHLQKHPQNSRASKTIQNHQIFSFLVDFIFPTSYVNFSLSVSNLHNMNCGFAIHDLEPGILGLVPRYSPETAHTRYNWKTKIKS
jgi:hypothetical protein